MRDNWLSNRVFASYTDRVDHCCEAWNKLIERPGTILSIGFRDWANELCSARDLVSTFGSATSRPRSHRLLDRRGRGDDLGRPGGRTRDRGSRARIFGPKVDLGPADRTYELKK